MKDAKKTVDSENKQALKDSKGTISSEAQEMLQNTKKTTDSAWKEAQTALNESLTDSQKALLASIKTHEIGKGKLDLLTTKIKASGNQLKFTTEGIDENQTTFIYVANKKVFQQKIHNGQKYTLDIKNIPDAHRTNYKPKVFLMQFKYDKEFGDIITAKEARYTVSN